MQGIFVNGRRPTSKAAVKRAAAAGESVALEATSMFGNEYDGPIERAPVGTYYFVGPDPYVKRSFYGTVKVAAAGSVRVS